MSPNRHPVFQLHLVHESLRKGQILPSEHFDCEAGLEGLPCETAEIHHVRGAAAANFGSATAHALKNHASLSNALVAGATAAVGGPAVVATITAAAPIVLGVAVGVAAVAGTIALVKWLDEL